MPVTCLIHRFGGQEVLRKDGQDPTEALVEVCVAGVAWRLVAEPLSSLSPGPRLPMPPSSRLCSPTTPPGKAQGTAGDVALSE